MKTSDKIICIEKLWGCIKCGYIKHKTKFCKYKLKNRCFKCRDWHVSLLCSEEKELKLFKILMPFQILTLMLRT